MRWIGLFIVVLTLVGCRGGPGPVLVDYSKSGGIAALDDTLQVRESGAMTLTQRRGGTKAGTATAEELARLRTLFESREFATVPAETKVKGFDQISYTIRARGRVIRTVDGTEWPRALQEAIQELERLWQRCQASTPQPVRTD